MAIFLDNVILTIVIESVNFRSTRITIRCAAGRECRTGGVPEARKLPDIGRISKDISLGEGDEVRGLSDLVKPPGVRPARRHFPLH
jgi:hypothetical protein